MKNLLFLSAFPEETQSVLKFFDKPQPLEKKIMSAQVGNTQVVSVETGMGFQNVDFSLKKIQSLSLKWEHIYIIGFCGGLDDTLEVGQIISADEALLFQNDELQSFSLHGLSDTHVISKIVSIDKIIKTIKEKKDLYHATQATAVDMETAMVASVFQNLSEKAPLSVVKAVMDSGEQELPQNLRNPLAEEKNLLMELKNNMKMARERLEKDFLENFFDDLAEEGN
jgi:nucleoside phosphorylase